MMQLIVKESGKHPTTKERFVRMDLFVPPEITGDFTVTIEATTENGTPVTLKQSITNPIMVAGPGGKTLAEQLGVRTGA